MNDQAVYHLLTTLLVVLAGSYLLVVLARALGAGRPGFGAVGVVLAAFALRVVGALAVSLTGIGPTLRGGDELVFLANAHEIAMYPVTNGAWTKAPLHEVVFALQFRFLGDVPDISLRAVQALFGVTALLFLAAAVYDLAGPRAGRIALCLLAIEPTSVFFSTLLHKEALMLLAAGLVVFGGTLVWQRVRLDGVALIGLGCLIGIGTRPYAGYFLAGGATLVVLHGSLRNARQRALPALILLAVGGTFVVAVAPTVTAQTSDRQLETRLQGSQDANANDASNLKLEQVDFSTRGAVVANLPRRIRDVTLRPYPWQVGNASQLFGVVGTVLFLIVLAVLVAALKRRPRGAVRAVGPVGYIAMFVLIGYALSTGNAGTGFRYRTHVVQLSLCAAVILRQRMTRPELVAEPRKFFVPEREPQRHVPMNATLAR